MREELDQETAAERKGRWDEIYRRRMTARPRRQRDRTTHQRSAYSLYAAVRRPMERAQ